MINWTNNKKRLNALLLGTALLSATITTAITTAHAETPPPALIITNEPLPAELESKIYSTPTQTRTITPRQISGEAYYNESLQTNVGQKLDNMRGELFSIQGRVASLAENLAGLEQQSQQQAAEYYASVATISTQLQSGTTPGNPRLVSKLGVARSNLERLSGNIASLNDLAMDISNVASMTSYIMEATRAAYGLSGAIEEDHVRLAQLEDAINNTMVVIDRLLNNVNDDISRTTAYIGSERNNLRTLSMAIRTGDLFGKSLSNRPFSHAAPASIMPASLPAPSPVPPAMAPANDMMAGYPDTMPSPAIAPAPMEPRPLVKIRFDRANVAYEQPVYMAVNEALTRFPNAKFELIAVHPARGNAAEIAIESTRSRRNAERVLRSLTEMGLSVDQIDLSYMPSEEARTNEVHLYIR
jgi:hypothetical protein